MGGKEEPAGWGLSSEQYDEGKVLEVDTRSVDYDELRKQAKDPGATWSEKSASEPADEEQPPEQSEQSEQSDADGDDDVD